MKDLELIEYIQNNTVKNCDVAMRQIYKECYPMTESLILKNSGSIEDAKDIFQETMILFYYKVKSEEFELSSKISTFLYSISKNQWYKKIRDDKKAKNIEIPDYLKYDSKISSTPNIQEVEESHVALAELLEKSGEKCVKLLKSFYIEKLSMLKIAQLFEYSSEQVAKNKKARCLKKIRAFMLQNKKYEEKLINMF